MDAVTYALAKKNGGSADVTAAAVAAAIGNMNSTQKASSRAALDTALEPMVVEFTHQGDSHYASETLADIQAAIAAGREVRCVNEYGAEGKLHGQDVGKVSFSSFDDQNGGGALVLRIYTITSSGCEYEEALFTREPKAEVKTGPVVNSFTASDNTIYDCGECTEITVGSQSGTWVLTFTSGSTPTNLVLPSSVKEPDDFDVEANREYEISVFRNRMMAHSWEVAAS